MRNWKAILMVLFVGFWLAASTHCGWEQLADLPLFACQETANPSQSSPASHCDDTFCQTVESGHYLSPQQKSSDLLQAAVDLWLLQPCVDAAALDETYDESPRVMVEPPPELPRRWQFVFRAALPARAPSIAS